MPSGCSPQTPVTGNATTGNGLGDTGFYTYYSQTLDDRSSLLVNVANGNLVLDATDLHIRGTGIDLNIQRFFNSFSTSTGSVGKGWVLGTGSDVKLVIHSGSATFDGPGGYVATFTTNSSGAYQDAPGLNATLIHVSGNSTYTVTFHRSGECLVFNSVGQLTTDSDRNGNQLAFAYDGSGRLTTITDTQ
ncbi:MAG: DUF6531 domain-containing protein, partial [Ktedonobacterales bacterium]